MRTARRHWPLIKRLLTWAFLLLVVVLIGVKAQDIDWPQVGESVRNYRASTLLKAAALAVASYATYSCYDLVGRVYTRHTIPRPHVMAVGFVSYAFNLNLSAWIGGIGFRYRLYSRFGLRGGVITRILALSMLTNWLGYLVLAGLVFVTGQVPLPEGWAIGQGSMRVVGALLLCAAAVYLGVCAFAQQRHWTIRGTQIQLPRWRMALVQFGLSVVNWLLIASILFVLIQGKVAFPVVLAVLLLAAIAGVIAHIPAGLGVLEAVFLTLLGDVVGEGPLVAALLAYRALYFIFPLAIAIAVYLALEAKGHAHSLPRATAGR